MTKPAAYLSWCLGILMLPAAMGACTQIGAPDESTRFDAAKGQMLFAEKCAVCHGADAKGGGPASLGLGVVPPGLTMLAKRNAGVFPQDEVMTVIDGYYRSGHYADPMPNFGEEDMGPLIQVERDGVSTPIPADLLALANYLESIQE